MPLASPTKRLPAWPVFLLAAALSVGAFAASFGTTRAATLTVTNTSGADVGSLRAQIIAASAGDTIDFSVTGTITLLTGQLVIDKDLTISGPGAASLTINGNANSRIFSVSSGVTASISGLTLTNGNVTGGGNIGGAIFNSGLLTVSSSVISGNSTDFSGGGIASISGGTLTVTDSTISGNSAGDDGGGIWNASTALIERSTISGNSSSQAGGGIANDGTGTLTIEISTVSDNSASSAGGGIFNTGVTLIVRRLTISGNVSGVGVGGGIFSASPTTIVNSTISGNLSGRGGGIDFTGGAGDSDLTITNTTITANEASIFGGGGIAILGGSITFVNSIIAGNTGKPATPSLQSVCLVFGGTLTSLGNNVIGDPDGCDATFIGSDQLNTDPLLGALADNGGLTKTHALLTGSPAIDAGNDALAPATDQRGVLRTAGGQSDIGAFEVALDADLSIAKSASSAFVAAAANLTYTITVTNGGPGTASDVTVTDTLPGAVAFVSASAGCSESSGTVTCTTASLANGANVQFTITVTAPGTGGSISNTASVTSSAADPTSSNDSVTLVTTVINPPSVPGLTTWGLGALALALGALVLVARRRRAAPLR